MARWFGLILVGLMGGMVMAAWAGDEARVLALLFSALAIIAFALYRERLPLIGLVLVVLALWSGIFWYGRALGPWQGLTETVEFAGEATIVERGEVKVFYRPVTLRPSDGNWSGGDILYRAPLSFAGKPGEAMNFRCVLKRPENFEPNFDYRMLLAARGTGYVCERGGEVTAAAHDRETMADRFLGAIYTARTALRGQIATLLPEPEAGLLVGLLIGGSDTLAPLTKDAFTRAGLSHIVAVSGYNMSVVAEGLVLLALLFGLWRRRAIIIAVLGLLAFLLFIDGSAASLRAALMAWFAFAAYFFGRPGASWNGLLIAATGMLLWNPLLIRFDVGFQLSFLATLALLFLARSFETFAFFRNWYGKVAGLFLTTVVIELFTLPVILSSFGTLSIIAPVANTLILPLVPVAMFAGMAILFITAIFPTISFFVLPFAWLPLMAIVRLAEWFAAVPFAQLAGFAPSATFAMLWYLGLLMTVALLEHFRHRYVLGMDH